MAAAILDNRAPLERPRAAASTLATMPAGLEQPSWHRAATGAAFAGAGLFALLAAAQLLLWRFLDFAPWWLYGAGLALAGATGALAGRLTARAALPAIGPARLGLCVAVAAALYLLGGEGRLLYANADWQVRDAILRDMTVHAWPFAYTGRGLPEMLRAPVGMYLLPSLAGKAGGPVAADWALLAQNSLLLGLTLALASLRFASRRAAGAALALFLCFSGMDIVGQLVVDASTGQALPSHLDAWAGLQYSSHITQAFWVPQHALCGWIAAALFLLWKDRGLPVGLLLGALPLLALWSPLGGIGALPFAGYAAWQSWRGGTLGRDDVAFAALATLLAAPSLVYLSAAGGSVGLSILAVPLWRWSAFQLVEVLPYLAGVAAIGLRRPHAGATLAIAAALLLFLPFVQIGESIDLMMRGSIPALAILSMLVADALTDARGGLPGQRRWAWLLAVTLALGSLTGLSEIRRAFLYQPAPRPLCSFLGAWDQSFAAFGKSTYLAPVAALARPLRPAAPELLPPVDPPRCWVRPWAVRRTLRE